MSLIIQFIKPVFLVKKNINQSKVRCGRVRRLRRTGINMYFFWPDKCLKSRTPGNPRWAGPSFQVFHSRIILIGRTIRDRCPSYKQITAKSITTCLFKNAYRIKQLMYFRVLYLTTFCDVLHLNFVISII